MKELLRRLTGRPVLAFEILVGTFFIALLNLASPLFVIQVLNRYISYGFDGTLYTLTAGMTIAVVLQFGFRQARTKMTGAINAGPEEDLSRSALSALTRAKAQVLDRIPKARLHEILSGVQTVQSAYDPGNILAVLDAPFALLYVLAVFFLSPFLALVCLIGMGLALVFGAYSLKFSRKTSGDLKRLSLAHRSSIGSAVSGPDAVRAFRGRSFLARLWNEQLRGITLLRLKLADRKELSQSLTASASILMTVALYAFGAVRVVKGDLTVGALIGCNILASRAFGNIVRLVQTSYLLSKAEDARRDLAELSKLPAESETGTVLSQYSGRLAFKDLAFAYPAGTGPLFESLNLELAPGEVLVVNGYNGSGKTTLARLILGLLEPKRGEILADGVNLRQVSMPWWRSQVMYVPQEPGFISGTLRENITMADPDLPDAELNKIIHAADLRRYLDQSPKGLNTELMDSGRNLALGIRKRLALARALTANGQLAVLDEPTEGLDKEGRAAVYEMLNAFTRDKKTVVVVTHDPDIMKGANFILDLSQKPAPRTARVKIGPVMANIRGDSGA